MHDTNAPRNTENKKESKLIKNSIDNTARRKNYEQEITRNNAHKDKEGLNEEYPKQKQK